jgi:PIF1-like helicase
MAAAIAAGIMNDDKEYHKCLSTRMLSPPALRSVFMIILQHCQPADPTALLRAFFHELCEDFVGSAQQKQLQLFQMISSSVDVPLEDLGLDTPLLQSVPIGGNNEFLESFVSHPISLPEGAILNIEQQIAHDAVIWDLTRPTARTLGLRIVPCASSALAASLLGHARTAHALFKVPIATDEHSTCKPSAAYKKWLRSIHCFVWDEISMAHKWALDAVERLLRDIHQCDAPFGGVTMVLAGDMQQLLPVHRFAKDPAAYCVSTCSWFDQHVSLSLARNIRAAEDAMWAAFVASVGRGAPAVFPSHCVVDNADALISAVWPGGNFRVSDNRSILTMTRDDAATINKLIIELFPGVPDCALSLDNAMVSVHFGFAFRSSLIHEQTGLRPIILPN